MLKYVVAVVIGAAAGAAIAYIALNRDAAHAPRLDASPLPAVVSPIDSPIAPVSSAEQTDVLRALERLASNEPRAALADALALADQGMQRVALRHIGALWASSDPQAALSHAATLPPALQGAVRDSVSATWAQLDSAGFLRYARTVQDLDTVAAGLEVLVATEPAGVFEVTSSERPPYGSPLFNDVHAAALRAMVERDPEATLAYLLSLPADRGREQLLRVAADAYVLVNPEAALEWTETFNTFLRTAQSSAISSLAAFDFDRAERLASAHAGWQFPDSIFGALVTGALRDLRGAPDLANRLLARSDEQGRRILAQFVDGWVSSDTPGALDWLIANQSGISAAMLGGVGASLAIRDPDAAARIVDQLPAHWRDAWIEQMAGPYAQNDFSGALDWLAQFEGERAYEDALTRVVTSGAPADPRLAAQIVALASPRVQSAAALSVARSLSADDPAAAADWASDLLSVDTSIQVVRDVAGRWMLTDPAEVGRWVLTQPSGAVRDSVVTLVLNRSWGHDLDLAPFIEAYSSDEARRQGLAEVLDAYAGNEIAAEVRGRVLASISDPALRRWAERHLRVE